MSGRTDGTNVRGEGWEWMRMKLFISAQLSSVSAMTAGLTQQQRTSRTASNELAGDLAPSTRLSWNSTGPVSAQHPRDVLADTPDILARMLRGCRACRATFPSSLPRAYLLVGRRSAAVQCCPFVRVSCRSL